MSNRSMSVPDYDPCMGLILREIAKQGAVVIPRI